MSYEFGFVLSLALLKFLMSWFVWLDTECKPLNYTTRVNGVKFFRAGVCTPARACARGYCCENGNENGPRFAP